MGENFPGMTWVGKNRFSTGRRNNVDPLLRSQMEGLLGKLGLYGQPGQKVRFYSASESERGGASAVGRTAMEELEAGTHVYFGLRSVSGSWTVWEVDVTRLLEKYQSARIPLNRSSASSCGRQIPQGEGER